MLLDDLIDDLTPDVNDDSPTGAADAGWSKLMRLASQFPLDALSYGSPVITPAVPAGLLPQPRQVSYEDANDLVDGSGDGPSIGLGVGMSLAAA